MKLRTWAGVCALAMAPAVYAASLPSAKEAFCDLNRYNEAEVNCRADVSAPTGGGAPTIYSRLRTWNYPDVIRFQLCTDWDPLQTSRNRSLTFAEFDFRAPDKPNTKAMLVLSARQSSGVQYLVIDWLSPTATNSTASGVLASSVPVAVLPITACSPVLADPYWNIGTEVKVETVSMNEIEVKVGTYAPVKVKARLGSTQKVVPTEARVAPLIYDYVDASYIRTLWFPN